MDDQQRRSEIHGFLAAYAAGWIEQGWVPDLGIWHERRDAEGRPLVYPNRRLVSAARQLFTFSQAAVMLGDPALSTQARLCYQGLITRFKDPQEGGWYFSVDALGQPLDTKKDLYGHAFVLFALAHHHATLGCPEAILLATETHGLLRQHLLTPAGWFATSAARDWRHRDEALSQNPNMHLFEAYLALETTTGDPVWRAAADGQKALFDRFLFDRETGVLGEHFDAAGQPDKTNGHIIEPGHHYEWCWLLHEHAKRRNLAPPEAAHRLFDWARRFGTDPDQGGIYDQVSRSGQVLRDSKRVWPVTECIKACAVRARDFGDANADQEMRSWLDFLFLHYMRPNGRWFEILDQKLRPSLDEMPATTGYHLLMSFIEAIARFG